MQNGKEKNGRRTGREGRKEKAEGMERDGWKKRKDGRRNGGDAEGMGRREREKLSKR